MRVSKRMKMMILVLSLGMLSPGLMAAEEVDPDPYRHLNEATHRFNDFFDRLLIRPIALGYSKVVPGFIRHGIGNAFDNLEDVGDAVNNLLQGKVGAGLSDVVRVSVNTTIGIGGLFDPATSMGMIDHEEDFGQTFGKWGIGPGPYLVIPGLGPSTVRDGLAKILDAATDPVFYLRPARDGYITYGVRMLHQRADLLSVEKVVFGDKYIFYRDAYLQRREYLVNDGEVSDPFEDDF